MNLIKPCDVKVSLFIVHSSRIELQAPGANKASIHQRPAISIQFLC